MKRNTPISRFAAACVIAVLAMVGTSLPPSAAIGGFGDVPGDAFYADAVQWLVDEDLTQGTGPGCFSPDDPLSRGQFATFIWRYAGSPSGGTHPFVDVATGAFYASAVSWMYSQGLTTGTSASTYSPDRHITRGEVATFLWRYEGSPSAPPSWFVDVAVGAFYADAVAWMVAEGITSGTSATTFTPTRQTTRGEFATFLYRYSGSPGVVDSGSGTCGGTGGTRPAPVPPPTDSLFFEDFVDGGAMSRFEADIFHRDDFLGNHDEWPGDHAILGPDDLCGPPSEKRIVQRGERETDFNDDWIYRCAPGGDTAKAHLMTSIGEASGYSIGAFTPNQVFTGVREVRWDVNQTDLGDRQWTEVAIIPAGVFDFQNLPCATDVPCETVHHNDLGSVGTQWGGLRTRRIVTPEEPGGYTQANNTLGYQCGSCPFGPSKRFGEDYGVGDPALTSIVIRRHNYFRDNGNGTLTWGFQLDDGSFNELTVPGSFPEGPVRVVFKDHNYTQTKSPATLLPETTFTWHWDNIAVDLAAR